MMKTIKAFNASGPWYVKTFDLRAFCRGFFSGAVHCGMSGLKLSRHSRPKL